MDLFYASLQSVSTKLAALPARIKNLNDSRKEEVNIREAPESKKKEPNYFSSSSDDETLSLKP